MTAALPFSPMQPAKLDIAQIPSSTGTVVAQLTGKLSLETVSGFLQQLVLNMSGISFLDSAGVGALVQLFVHRKSKSQKFALAALTPQGVAVMQVSGLVKLLPSFATVEEASAA
jgi:anti-anti-sigma factor